MRLHTMSAITNLLLVICKKIFKPVDLITYNLGENI